MQHRALLFDAAAVNRQHLLREHLQTDWDLRAAPDRTDLASVARQLAGCEVFVGNEFPPALSSAAADLRLIQCVGAGTDLFDLAALPAGSTLCNVYQHEIPIAEHILLSVLLFATRLREHEAALRQGIWQGSGRLEGAFHTEVYGKRLGLIGFGHIGVETARRARAFGMSVAAVRRHPAPHPDLAWCGDLAQLPRLLAESDFVAIVCPLTTETRGLIAEPQLRLLKSSAVLINVSRAAIVDEEPLYRALSGQWFAGAALDVWYDYPTGDAQPHHGSRFAFHKLPNLVMTPHCSAWTGEMMSRRYRDIAGNLDRLARGEPLANIVHRA